MASDANAPVDELHLSVKAERAVRAAGIRTVGELQAKIDDLASIGLRTKLHRRAIVRALAQWEKERGAREALVEAARQAMIKLTDAERAQVHAAVGCCTCAGMAKFVAQNPGAAVGAAIGGLFGALLSADRGSDPKKPALPECLLPPAR